MKIVIAFDGSTVWMDNPMMGDGPQQITGPQADMAKGDADFDSILLDYKAKGHAIELVGTEPDQWQTGLPPEDHQEERAGRRSTTWTSRPASRSAPA